VTIRMRVANPSFTLAACLPRAWLTGCLAQTRERGDWSGGGGRGTHGHGRGVVARERTRAYHIGPSRAMIFPSASLRATCSVSSRTVEYQAPHVLNVCWGGLDHLVMSCGGKDRMGETSVFRVGPARHEAALLQSTRHRV